MRASMLLAGIAALCVLAAPIMVRSAYASDEDSCKVGNFTAKIAACTSLIKSGRWSGSGLAWAYVDRGQAYLDHGDTDVAIADFNEAIRLDPKYADAYIGRSVAYRNKGDRDRAAADNREAMRLNPAEANKSICFQESGDAAIAGCNKAITSGKFDGSVLSVLFENRGIEYSRKGLRERARSDYTEAIRLNPKTFSVYNDRGDDYRIDGDYERALLDLDIAIRLNPNWAQAYKTRAEIYRDRGDPARAVPDYDQAIRLDPQYMFAYFGRGRANLLTGALPRALADLNQVTVLAPKNAYAALWLDIAARRSKLASRLPQAVAQFDMTSWPAPLVQLYLGQLTPEAVLAAADNADPDTKRTQVCEANFYSAELALRGGAMPDATRLFRAAASDCPAGFERTGAIAELKTMGVTQ
jgi:tetratricopeptide (TPR) repeat protein